MRVAPGCRGRGQRRFFHHDMRIRATDAEGADSGEARAFPAFPVPVFAYGRKRTIREINPRIRRLVIEQRRDFFVAELLNRLDHSGHAGSTVEVADVVLAGADGAEFVSLCTSFAEGFGEGGDFNRIA